MRKLVIGVVLAFAATALAGCVGDFEVKQTEPLRIQIDGEGEDAKLACNSCDSGDGIDTRSEQSEFRIDTDGGDVDQVMVVVEVTNVQVDGDDDMDDEPTMTTGN